LDASDAFSTSFDTRFSPMDIFSKNKPWVSTGYYPQVITFRFIKKWVFRTIEMQCLGSKELSVIIGNDTAYREQIQCRELTEGYFICDLSNEIASELKSETKTQSALQGDILIIRFHSGIEDFIVIENLVIKAFQC
jgi:hypothetical protein